MSLNRVRHVLISQRLRSIELFNGGFFQLDRNRFVNLVDSLLSCNINNKLHMKNASKFHLKITFEMNFESSMLKLEIIL